MRSTMVGMEPARVVVDEVVVILRGQGVIAQLADACERYGWQLPLAPFIPDGTAWQVLTVLHRDARKRRRVRKLRTFRK